MRKQRIREKNKKKDSVLILETGKWIIDDFREMSAKQQRNFSITRWDAENLPNG